MGSMPAVRTIFRTLYRNADLKKHSHESSEMEQLDSTPKKRRPYIIGIAGGTASGKSSVCAKLLEMLGEDRDRVCTISQDSFYRNLNEKDSLKAKEGLFNFDHPDAFEQSLLLSVLNGLCEGEEQKIPKYDFVTNSRLEDEYEIVTPHSSGVWVIIVEGILVFYDEQLRNMFNMRVFVDADTDTRLSRRVQRDTEERGRELPKVLNQYLKLVKPAFEEFCLPTKKYADIIVPRGVENLVAIDVIIQRIRDFFRNPDCADDLLERPEFLDLIKMPSKPEQKNSRLSRPH